MAIGQTVLGLMVSGSAWLVSWSDLEPWRFHTFFPLWLGYILLVDGITRVWSGSSLLVRMGRRFALLFVVSIPFWWVFEAANARLDNWSYMLPHPYSWIRYHLEASLAFSTVVPAVFVTAELIRSAMGNRQFAGFRVTPSRAGLASISALGGAVLVMVMLLPELLFPLVWISLFLMIDPIVALLGGRSISAQISVGRWDTVVVLFAATLICGFFWEMWNSRALPKWDYDIPYAEWWHVFEMPLLGFGGYLPFGLELYALFNLVDRLLGVRLAKDFRYDLVDLDQ